jgi:hypothetical protein
MWHEPVGTFVHAPTFVAIDTSKVLGLKQGEVVQKLDFKFEQNRKRREIVGKRGNRRKSC